MQNSTKISCVIDTSDPLIPLGVEIWIDNTCLLDLDHVSQLHTLESNIADDDSEHELRFILKNKLSEHTTVSEQGEIVKDAVLYIKNIQFDDIDLGKIVSDLAVYTHNFNGTAQTVQNRFYDVMGCNGTVSLKFSTPIYIWLLENM
jgi:hypothetical protein